MASPNDFPNLVLASVCRLSCMLKILMTLTYMNPPPIKLTLPLLPANAP